MAPKHNPLAQKIKKLLQTDEEVGKIAQATPSVLVSTICRSSCIFLRPYAWPMYSS